MSETDEQWIAIPGYEGFYEVSNLGQVRSLERTEVIGRSTRRRSAKVLKPDGTRTRLLRDGVYRSFSIQGLVDTLFPETVQASISEPGEEWLPIPGYEGIYEVSSHYRVRSIARTTTHGQHEVSRIVRTKILSTYRNNGYLVAHLFGTKEQEPKKFYVEATVENLFPHVKPEIDDDLSQPGEEWLPVAGYEGLYEISNFGRIKSLSRYVAGIKRRFARPYVRLNGATGNGYPKVELAKDGVIKTLLIHRLVAAAFVPNPENLPVVHHRDENPLNSRSDNLEWVTNKANVQDWFDRRRVVISAETIDAIFEARSAGKSTAEILAALPRKRKTKP